MSAVTRTEEWPLRNNWQGHATIQQLGRQRVPEQVLRYARRFRIFSRLKSADTVAEIELGSIEVRKDQVESLW
jgi:hypothetical protein